MPASLPQSQPQPKETRQIGNSIEPNDTPGTDNTRNFPVTPPPFIFRAGNRHTTPLRPSTHRIRRRGAGTSPAPTSQAYINGAGGESPGVSGLMAAASQEYDRRTTSAIDVPYSSVERREDWVTRYTFGERGYRVGFFCGVDEELGRTGASSSSITATTQRNVELFTSRLEQRSGVQITSLTTDGSIIAVRGSEIAEQNQDTLQERRAGRRLSNSRNNTRGSFFDVLYGQISDVDRVSETNSSVVHANDRFVASPERPQRSVSQNGSSATTHHSGERAQGLTDYNLLKTRLVSLHLDCARARLEHLRRKEKLRKEALQIEAKIRNLMQKFNIRSTIPMLPDSAWYQLSPELLWDNMSVAVRSIEVLFHEVRAQRMRLQRLNPEDNSTMEENYRALEQRISELRDVAKLHQMPNRHRAAAVRAAISQIDRLMVWSRFLIRLNLRSQPEDSQRVHKVEENPEVCVICLESLRSDVKQKVLKLPRCGHSFHSTCIRRWLEIKNTCPLCCQEVKGWK